ncbi:MAG: class I SAM-dependent methyltransferase [Anaerolineae bacterium]|nr:class I SAM-dependent methyltransferase [Anaerolineae bacterium]
MKATSESLNLSVVPQQPCDVDFGWYEEIRDELLRQTVGQAGRVLDVGCGRGQVLLMLSGQIGEGIGIDVADEDLSHAESERQERGAENVSFRHGDALGLAFPDASFDVVLLLGDVLTYIDPAKHGKVVADLYRVLKPGGQAVHESMNWTWEYRWPYPKMDIAFKRAGKEAFTAHRLARDAFGLEASQDYEVLPDTPLHRWIVAQEWPVSPQEASTWLEVQEHAPIPEAWLKPSGRSQFKHYCSGDLERLYSVGGFCSVEAFAYGQIYDLVNRAGLLEQIAPFQSQLACTEAELALTLRLGSGPWLFAVAEKGT